jgi:hypothetical protein
MNIRYAILILSSFGLAPSAQPNPKPVAEQHFFNLEDAVLNQVDLSDAELAALAQDDLMRQEMRNDPPIAKLTQDGLEASVVHLGTASERDLIVIGSGTRYAGANVAPFWIIRDLPDGPVVVAQLGMLGLTIEDQRTKGMRNIDAFVATASEGTTTYLRFDGRKYVKYKQKTAPLGK